LASVWLYRHDRWQHGTWHITKAQPMIWNWFIFQNPLSAAILFIALLAEVSRAPFDLVEASRN